MQSLKTEIQTPAAGLPVGHTPSLAVTRALAHTQPIQGTQPDTAAWHLIADGMLFGFATMALHAPLTCLRSSSAKKPVRATSGTLTLFRR